MKGLFSFLTLLMLYTSLYSQVSDFSYQNLSAFYEKNPVQIEQIVNRKIELEPNDSLKCELMSTWIQVLLDNYEYDKAESLLEESITLSKKLDDPYKLAKNYQMKATSLMFQDVRLQSTKYFQEALAIYEELADSLNMGIVLDKIADNHNYIGDHEMARGYYEKCVEIFRATKSYSRLSNVIGNIGGMLSDDGYYDSAYVYYKKAIDLDTDLKDSANLRMHISGLAMLLEDKGSLDSSLVYHRRAFKIAELVNDPIDRAFAHQHLGYYFFRRGKMDSAEYYMVKTHGYAQEMKNAQLLTNSSNILHQVYASKYDFPRAYKYLNIEKRLGDSLMKVQNISEIAALRSAYEIEKKNAENELLRVDAALKESELTNQRTTNYILAIGAILLLLGLILLIFLYSQRRKISSQLQKDKDIIEEQAERLKEMDKYKSRFFANISHDYRTPLTLIQGYTELITKDHNQLTEKSEKALQHIQKSVDRLNLMTDEIRELIKLEEKKIKLNLSKIDVNAFFATLADMFKAEAKTHNITLYFHSDVEEGRIIHADKYALEKIIFNLIDNSLKYNTTGSKIRFEVAGRENEIIFSVADDGPGIPGDKLPLIFERYYQNDENQHALVEGQGIGLSIVKDYVELHGGDIEVSSTPDVETRFSITLPENLDKEVVTTEIVENTLDLRTKRLLESKGMNTDQQVSDNKKSDKKKSGDMILVADDHPAIRDYIKEILEDKYLILEASNGEEALFILKNTQNIKLLITDLMMPKMSGYHFIEHLQKSSDLKHMPMLIISADVNGSTKIHSDIKANHSFIGKPFTSDTLKNKITELIN